MKNLSDIKHRIKSISDTRKITNAMETISVAKMRKAMNGYDCNRAYFEAIRGMINDVLAYTEKSEHKVFLPSANKKAAIIVIASDKGLAGGFNLNVLKFADSFISRFDSPCVFAVGQMGAEHFDAKGIHVDSSYVYATFDPSVSDASAMGACIYDMFSCGKADSAYIVYTSMTEHGRTEPKALQLLPFGKSDGLEADNSEHGYTTQFIYEPSPKEVLEYLIPQYLTGMIYGALIESSACEHSERRNAMNSATKSATDLLDVLHIEYNRARQESITGEITEIVTAANGVKDYD